MKSNKVNKIVLIILFAVSCLFIGYIMYKNYSVPSDKILKPESFYKGTSGELQDPKGYYYSLHGLTLDTSDETNVCDIKRYVDSDNGSIADTKYNFFTKLASTDRPQDSSKDEWVNMIGQEGEGLFKDGQNIICPLPPDCYFQNGNAEPHTFFDDIGLADTQIDIAITQAEESDILVVFTDVKCWYCHKNYKGSTPQHNIPIGNGTGNNSKVNKHCMVLGLAKDSTTIKVYKVKDSFVASDKHAMDVSSAEQVQQIHAGKYFVLGEESPV